MESRRKHRGSTKIVVDAAIDDIHAAQAGGGAHVDDVVVHEQIAAFDQFDAHLLRQKSVLEIGGVVNAGGEQRRSRFVAAAVAGASARRVASSACA